MSDSYATSSALSKSIDRLPTTSDPQCISRTANCFIPEVQGQELPAKKLAMQFQWLVLKVHVCRIGTEIVLLTFWQEEWMFSNLNHEVTLKTRLSKHFSWLTITRDLATIVCTKMSFSLCEVNLILVSLRVLDHPNHLSNGLVVAQGHLFTCKFCITWMMDMWFFFYLTGTVWLVQRDKERFDHKTWL